MKPFKLIIAAVFPLVLLAAQPALPQGSTNPPLMPMDNLKSGDIESSPELKASFATWKKGVETGDEAASFAESSKMLEVMNKLGTRNLETLADMCMATGHLELSKRNYAGAYLAAKHATFFAPDDPQTHFFLAAAAFEKNKGDIRGVASNLVAGFKAIINDRFHRDKFMAKSAMYISVSALLAFGLVFAVMLARHYKALAANITELLPSIQDGNWKYIVSALLLIIPLAIGGWPLFLMALPLFLWPSLRLGEKLAIVVFALFAVAAPYISDYMAKGAALAGADTYRALYLLSKNTWDYETKLALERERVARPDDTVAAFALGLLNKSRKDKDGAVQAYDAILKKNPQDVRALVNEGNAYYAAKEYDNAVEMFKKAIGINPNAVEAYFNLSVTLNEMLLTKDSEAEYNKALSLSAEQTRAFVAMTKDKDHEKRIVDFPISEDDLKAYSKTLEDRTREVSQFTWNAWFGSTPMNVYRGISLGFAALLALFQLVWMKKISNYVCGSCGAVFHPAIKLAGEAPQCNQCVAAQITKVAISSAKKDKKKKEMREYRESTASTAILLDRVAPGLGRVFAHESLTGLLFAFITCLIVVYGAMGIFPDLVSKDADIAGILKSHIPYFAAALFYWVIMNTALKRDFY